MHRRISLSTLGNDLNYRLLTEVFETRIDFDADFLEAIARDIADLSKELTAERKLQDDVLIRINHLQEVTMLIRVNIVDKQRIISSILKSQHFPDGEYAKIRVMIKDVGSLLEHTQFNFARLEYLQNTFLGLLDTDQSKVIKIFTVVTVVFMPPTLIASLYGMNFQYMPELSHKWGYPFALILMLLRLERFTISSKNWLWKRLADALVVGGAHARIRPHKAVHTDLLHHIENSHMHIFSDFHVAHLRMDDQICTFF